MTRVRTVFVCQQCGSQQSRWMGRCPDCGTWDSLVEQTERREAAFRSRSLGPGSQSRPLGLREVAIGGFTRLPVLGSEFVGVLGGGLVPGSVVLIGGEPGIGKSSLMLQAAAHFAEHVGSALYVSAEESVQQIKLRAARMGLEPERLLVYSETNLNAILDQIAAIKPRLVVVELNSDRLLGGVEFRCGERQPGARRGAAPVAPR
ncbi:MAG: AAA family ATPase [Roseiflexaceae bacterium]|nr:AAA family ATPase [Roseiflexaceae bacterium]